MEGKRKRKRKRREMEMERDILTLTTPIPPKVFSGKPSMGPSRPVGYVLANLFFCCGFLNGEVEKICD